ncbi:MAG: hypothetical protein ACI4QD_01535, partial [Kiritimatiellia bacterium]
WSEGVGELVSWRHSRQVKGHSPSRLLGAEPLGVGGVGSGAKAVVFERAVGAKVGTCRGLR